MKEKQQEKQQEIKNLDLMNKPSDKDVFKKIVEVLRENFVAVFSKENDLSLVMRFVSGQEFRLTIAEKI